MEFPDEKTMPIIISVTQNLFRVFYHDVKKVSKVCDKGDLEIFCYLVGTIFINGCHEYIEKIRHDLNNTPDQGLDAYMGCIEKLRNLVTDEKVLNCFEYPIEDWIDDAVIV